jgi:hypothetical protein
MHVPANKQLTMPPLFSIFILSAAALAYEVLMIRMFSIVHWHHFAFMIISIALLGYGASGSFITVFRRWLLSNYERVFIGNILLFSLSSLVCFIAVQHLPFNSLEILWDSSQWQRLLLSYLLLTLPFFFVANAIALTIMFFHKRIALVYGVDLVGAGCGALSVMLLLQVFSPGELLRVLAIMGAAAGLFALPIVDSGVDSRGYGRQRQIIAVALILSIIMLVAIPGNWLSLRMSEYKGLPQTLQVKDASVLSSHSSPTTRIDVVKSPFIPFRNAPGLSLQSRVTVPEQLAVFRDGDEMTTIDHVEGSGSLEYYDYMSSALPYHVHPGIEDVLVLASATGAQMLQAHFNDVSRIDVIEPDRQLGRLLTEQYADIINWSELEHKVGMHHISARGYAASRAASQHALSGNGYDLVIMGPSAASAGGSAGVHALSASYDYTVEALQSYLKQLAPDGLLSITMWTSNPARGNLKLFATAVEAMRLNDIGEPGKHLAWIRSWNTATLLLKNTVLTAEEINRVREFSKSMAFDLAWLPDIEAAEVNRFQRLQEPVFYLTAQSLLAQASLNQDDTGVVDGDLVDKYKYDISPATDDRPYFNNFFRWSSLKEFLAMPAQSGIAMIGVGYPTLFVTLLQALVAAFVLILLPLILLSSVELSAKKVAPGRIKNIIIYFFSIGLAFLFIEIAFIQKFTLILSQPLYAVAVALCAFLIFSGLGSMYTQRYLQRDEAVFIPLLLKRSVLMITLLAILYNLMLPLISNLIMSLPEALRILSAFLLTAPLAFVMGMPFPLGMAALQQGGAQLIPWAWGINGCASVVSAILAVILAMEIGFSGVILLAVALYLIAWFHSRLAG